MSRLIVHVEGQTEENFVNSVLAPYPCDRGYISVTARLYGNARQHNKRGGGRHWVTVRKGILNHLRQDQEILVTTMADYYGLRATWPGRARAPQLDFPDRAASIERKMLQDVSNELGGNFDRRRFVPYIVMHEYEGLLFSDPVRFGRSIAEPDLSADFQTIRDEFSTPEHINDSEITAPSKRIMNLFPGHQKILHGTQATQEIGLDTIRNECPLFSNWIAELEQRAV